MAEDRDALLSTLRSLSDGGRAAVERELVELGREAALGRLAADVAHDVANPLFGVLGLLDLLLEDTTPGSEDEARLRLLHQTTLELKRTVQELLDFARTVPGEGGRGDLERAAKTAVALVRHGIGKTLALEESYDGGAGEVACGEGELRQLLLHLLLAARSTDEPVRVEVARGLARVAPAASGLDALAARRIALDHGGSLETVDGAFELRLPAAV
jgi:signal transduction histidine kinase